MDRETQLMTKWINQKSFATTATASKNVSCGTLGSENVKPYGNSSKYL